jgi:hypothetical protein
MPMMKAYDEYLEFLTSSPSLEEIVNFEPAPDTKERAQHLFDTHDADTLTEEERLELDEYAKAVYFMEMIKIRARRKLGLSHDDQGPKTS